MSSELHGISRRKFLGRSAAATCGLAYGTVSARARGNSGGSPKKALIAITLDLEMARNFPKWEDTHWDYEKGNLNEETKRYAVEAARRVKAHGGVIHFFLVCRALEQENMDWLEEIIREGHSIKSARCVCCSRETGVQYQFPRPWLMKGKTPAEVL
jgi:hypothetical protein